MVGGSDHRDSRNWVVLELTRLGEIKIEEGTLEGLLRDVLGLDRDHPIFVPSVTYTTGGRKITIHLMEGYAFVASGLPEVRYLAAEGSSPYVRKVLTTKGPNGIRILSVIPDSGIQDMRNRLAQQVSSDIVEGTRVAVTEGMYNSLEGEVIGVHGDAAHVRFIMRSLDLIARIPRVFLTPVTEEP